MATKTIIVLLTEGDHDAAFLYRILKTNGFVSFSETIKDFPPPLNELLAKDILEVSISNTIQEARTRCLPSYVVTEGGEEKNIILIYATKGDTRRDIRAKLIGDYNSFNTNDSKEIQVIKDATVSVLYFFDADTKGIKARLTQINEELTKTFEGIKFEKFSANASLKMVDNILIGAYIFAEEGKDTGKLEDVLLPMMEKDNEDIFKAAKEFLSIRPNTNLYKDKLELNEDGSIKKVFCEKYDLKKSLIGTIGQLCESGSSNTVCISKAPYLNDEKIKANAACNAIVEFIRKAIEMKTAE